MQLYVWMASWQMECCGTPFRKSTEVSWRLRNPNSTELAWLDTVLHDGVAATIDAVEDHHGDSSAHRLRALWPRSPRCIVASRPSQLPDPGS